MKTTLFVAALTAMILSQAGVSAAESTPAILKSVKARKSLNAGQMEKVKGGISYALAYYNLAFNSNNLGLYGKANLIYGGNHFLNYNGKYNLGFYGKYNLGTYPYCNTCYLGVYGWH